MTYEDNLPIDGVDGRRKGIEDNSLSSSAECEDVLFEVHLTAVNKMEAVKKMTKNEFNALCGEKLIDVGVALEDEDICEALRGGNDSLVKHLLETNF